MTNQRRRQVLRALEIELFQGLTLGKCASLMRRATAFCSQFREKQANDFEMI
jgi:hypothetical protein